MQAVYYAARANLRRLMILHPHWTRAQLAQATGMSRSWVDKWKKRLLSVPRDDEQVLRGLCWLLGTSVNKNRRCVPRKSKASEHLLNEYADG